MQARLTTAERQSLRRGRPDRHQRVHAWLCSSDPNRTGRVSGGNWVARSLSVQRFTFELSVSGYTGSGIRRISSSSAARSR